MCTWQLKINQNEVKTELAEAQAWLARSPHAWFRLEAVGRCLHWLDAPDAAYYFQQAAQNYPVVAQPDLGYLTLGNYYRLAGDDAQSRQAYREADKLLAARLQESEPVINQRLICAFMLGQDEAVAEFARRVQGTRKKPDPRLHAFSLARVARARRTQAHDEAAATVQEIEAIIKRQRAKISDTGFLTHWDVYEIAQQTWHGIR